MDGAKPRWSLSYVSTNQHGKLFDVLSCHDVNVPDADYRELLEVLKRDFHAVKIGELLGPYSSHEYFRTGYTRFGLILDEVDSITLYAKDNIDIPAFSAIVARLVERLNGRDPRTAQRATS